MTASGGPGTQAVIAFDIGLWFALKDQHLWRIDVRATRRLSVDQPVQKVQHMGLGRDTLGQRHFHSDQHGLFVMLKACLQHDVIQDQRQDIDHLPIATRFAQHEVLQLFEVQREFRKGRTVPKCSGLALEDCQVMVPIVNRP